MTRLLCTLLLSLTASLPATAQTLDRIKETGVLNLGYRVDAAPMSYQAVGDKPAGYSPLVCISVGQAIVDHLQMADLEARFVPVDAANRFEKVANGEIDLLCGAATITLSRREVVDFSIPTFVDGTSILVKKDAPENFADYAGGKLGVRANTTTEIALRNTLEAAGMEAEVVLFDSHKEGREALENDEIKGYFADQTIISGLRLASSMPNQLKMSDEVLTIEKHGLAMQRGDTEFRLLVDRALSHMYASGEMASIFQEAIPGVEPGLALKAMYLIAPTLD